MKTFAVDASTLQGSVALCDGDVVISSRAWEARRGAGENFFTLIPGLMEEAGWTWEDVEILAVGRGPGMYSGLRSSMAAVRALALPAGQEVFAVSSGEVLAHEALCEHDLARVAVLGDARRQRVWYRIFDRDGSAADEEWKLAAYGELTAVLPAGITVVSSDTSKIRSLLDVNAEWIEEDRYPRAELLAALVKWKREKGHESESLSPIYMHPPVFVRPRFAQENGN